MSTAKILVLVLWHGRIQAEHVGKVRKKNFIKEGGLLALPGERRCWGHFYEMGREYIITWLVGPMDWGRSSLSLDRAQSPTFPNLILLQQYNLYNSTNSKAIYIFQISGMLHFEILLKKKTGQTPF